MNSIINIINKILQCGIDIWKEVSEVKNNGAATGTNYILTICPSSTRPTIPSDIVMDILSHASVENVLRYKSICKSWRNMLSTSYFVNLHMTRSPSLIYASIDRWEPWDGNGSGLEIIAGDCWEDYNMIASCNGLLAIRDEEDGLYYVLNPALRRRVRLPRPPDRWKSMQLYHLPSTNQYKLVCAHIDAAREYINLSVLTLGEPDWRHLPNCWATDISLSRDAPHLFRCEAKPTLPWIDVEDPNSVFSFGTVNLSDVGDEILSFDVESEALMEVELPQECIELCGQGQYSMSEFTEGWAGHFAITFYHDDSVTAFVLEDHRKKKWLRKDIVIHNKCQIDGEKQMREVKLATSHYHWVTDDDEGWLWFQDVESGLYAYHTKTLKCIFYKFQEYGFVARVCASKNTLATCDGM